MVNKLGNLKLELVNHIKTDYSFEFILLTIIYEKTLIYFVRHPKNAVQSFKSLSH